MTYQHDLTLNRISLSTNNGTEREGNWTSTAEQKGSNNFLGKMMEEALPKTFKTWLDKALANALERTVLHVWMSYNFTQDVIRSGNQTISSFQTCWCGFWRGVSLFSSALGKQGDNAVSWIAQEKMQARLSMHLEEYGHDLAGLSLLWYLILQWSSQTSRNKF